MLKYYIIGLLAVLICLLISSCEDNNLTQSDLTPEIVSISKNETFPGDTITFFGRNFGVKGDSGAILLNRITLIKGTDCIFWADNLVRFIVPYSISSGMFAIRFGSDTSNAIYISIDKKPRIDFLAVSAGEFDMGSKSGSADEMPTHKVKLTANLLVSKYEITSYLWNLLSDTSRFDPIKKDLPASGISWEEAVKFCNKLSQVEGLDTCYIYSKGQWIWDKSKRAYRLPTEAEWEYICRGGTEGDFGGISNIDSAGWFANNSGFNAQAVGRKLPNKFGLFDLHGNLREWCWDYYSETYYSVSQQIDPSGPSTGNSRVNRGGGYPDPNNKLRASARNYDDGDYSACGIRIVIEAK